MDILLKIKESQKFEINFIDYIVLHGQEPNNFLILSEILNLVVENYEKIDPNLMELENVSFLEKHKNDINKLAPFLLTNNYQEIYRQYILILNDYLSINNSPNIKSFNLTFLTLLTFAIKLTTFLANTNQ
jgi:hypothetical protein